MTREDIWGLVINEALSNGLPFITTRACNAGVEILNDFNCGYLVETNNWKKLSEKIKYLYDNNERYLFLKQNAIKAANDYTIEKMADDHYQIISKILVERRL